MKSIFCSTVLFNSLKLTHFSCKYSSSVCLHYFQWKTSSKSDRQEGSEPISKLNLNLFMFSLCLFVLVPMYSFSWNGYFLSLVFIFLCLKRAILFLLILHFYNLMKQVVLFIFHEERKYFWIILFCTFSSSNSLICLYAHFIGGRAFFVVLQWNGEKVPICSLLFPTSTVFRCKFAFTLPAKTSNHSWNLEWFNLKSSLNHVKGRRKTPTDFCCFRNIISLCY